MPLPGGATDKFGNRYESLWTVDCIIEVMDERANSIRLEPPGQEGEGIEFWVSRDNGREYHQVKRQNTEGRWTISALASKQILLNFRKKLDEPTAKCIFASTDKAYQLEELADRARRSQSWLEFEKEFLLSNNSQRKKEFSDQEESFFDLCSRWGDYTAKEVGEAVKKMRVEPKSSAKEAAQLAITTYEAIKRVYIRTIGEDDLRSKIESRLGALVEKNISTISANDEATVVDVLAQFALEKVHHELTALDIWYRLEERGYRRREWGKDPHVLAAVKSANNRYISSLRETQAIVGDVIPRNEAQIAFEELTQRKQGILLVGEAGVGKSSVMLQVLDKLQNQGVPVLTFRADHLESTLLPDQVGQQLGLPGSPAIVLANIAQKRDCVLIIDQLDAVSLASGRNPQSFDCLYEIIKQAQAHPNIKLLLACRKFDLDNDHRFKRLSGERGIAKPVIINRLSHAKVREIVGTLGLDTTRLSEKQLDLFSVPLHLALLAEIAEDKTIDVLNFQTAKELYDQFWNRKNDKIKERLRRAVKWTQVIDVLCNYINSQQQQSLSAPERVVDEFQYDAKAMASEHILIWEGKRISFFHESFFDYAFARRFASRDQNLLSFLGRREEQHLFRRAQVRQIFIHEREDNFDRYLNNLKGLLTSSDIRFHIKQVIFALLATLNDPSEEEWNIICLLIINQNDPITQQVWRTLYSSVSWFQLLKTLGVIEQWLRDKNEERVDQTVKLLSIMQRQIPEQVAELVEPFVGASEAWRHRLKNLVQGAELSAGRHFFDLFLRLIREGILDQAEKIIDNSRDFWMQIYSLPKQHPDWACEAISCYLNRYLDLSLAAGQPNLFERKSGALPHSQFNERILRETARNAPKAFIEHIFPFMLRVMELTAIREGNPPWYDSVWYYRPYGRGYDIGHKLLMEMEVALSSLAANNPEDFANFALEQLRGSNLETIQFLLIRAYAANGKRFASEAIDYLCEQPSRLKTGYRGAGNGNIRAAPYWATRQMIEATTPHSSEEKLIKLQAVIIDYHTDYEKSTDGRWFRGYPQLVLLDAIPPHKRTETVNRRLQELRRKFTDLKLLEAPGKIEPPQSMEVHLVGSPIPEAATDKMTDEQWLKAIARYDYDDLGTKFQRTGELIGGADQLSSLLESQVKKEPTRFASLIWRFPDNANSSYFNAVLQGIAEVGLDVETAVRVCQRCHQLPQRPCGRWICWLIQKLADLPWTCEALDILVWYALEDPDPEQELWRTETSGRESNYGGNIIDAGINSTRGSAVKTIAELIFADKNRASYFQIPIQQIVQDPSIAVRSFAAEALIAMLNYNRDVAVNLFLELCQTEDIFLATNTVENFLNYTLRTHFQQLAPILERMITSDLPEVVRVGARQACLSSLIIEEAHSFAERCLSGTESHRIAAAEIFVANLQSGDFREFCETGLIQAFNDSDEKVRAEAAGCFFWLEGEQLGEYVSLIQAFVASRAFQTDCQDLIYALEKTTAKLPDVTYIVCEKFITSFCSTAGDIRTRSASDADKISELVIRVYSESKDENLRTRCLDLVDSLTETGAYGLDKALQQFER